jgi:hypothetical protein
VVSPKDSTIFSSFENLAEITVIAESTVRVFTIGAIRNWAEGAWDECSQFARNWKRSYVLACDAECELKPIAEKETYEIVSV